MLHFITSPINIYYIIPNKYGLALDPEIQT